MRPRLVTVVSAAVPRCRTKMPALVAVIAPVLVTVMSPLLVADEASMTMPSVLLLLMPFAVIAAELSTVTAPVPRCWT